MCDWKPGVLPAVVVVAAAGGVLAFAGDADGGKLL